jgi:hypothetical protein
MTFLDTIAGRRKQESIMKSRCLIRGMLMLAALSAGLHGVVGAEPRSPIRELAIRQMLRDDVCLALADHKIDAMERFMLLRDAKRCLPAAEYASFRKALDRLSPTAPEAKKTVAKGVSVKKASTSTARRRPVVPSPPKLAVPKTVAQPDRIAMASPAW